MGKQGSLIKRFSDLILSLTTLIITFPILLVVALAIKIESKGPIFFIHERIGLNGLPFRMIKFRGMVNNALAIGPELTQKDDQRITRVGKFLRRTSIDEIPQVINVLKGEMSIVGPRPEIISITSLYSEDQREVFSYKPGITGISQIRGRQTLTPDERVKMECDHYKNETVWSDLRILMSTIGIIISNKGNI